MAYVLFTDSSANLLKEALEKWNIQVVSLTYSVGGEEHLCYDPNQEFDSDAFYASMQDPSFAPKTSMINSDAFERAFEPFVQAGQDILYIGMSSGISGTVAAGMRAAEELNERYPQNKILVIDTLAASLGEGLLVTRAAAMRENGATIEETFAAIEALVPCVYQRFLADDLMYLKRGGRISGAAALLGTVLSIKPIMRGQQGKIVLDCKVQGRKKALKMLAEQANKLIVKPEAQTIGIAHGGCASDAIALANMIRALQPVGDVMIVPYECGTGAHVGPGTVALFFLGNEEGTGKEPLIEAIKEKIESIDASKLVDAVKTKIESIDTDRIKETVKSKIESIDTEKVKEAILSKLKKAPSGEETPTSTRADSNQKTDSGDDSEKQDTPEEK